MDQYFNTCFISNFSDFESLTNEIQTLRSEVQEQASDIQELNENINKNTAVTSKTFDKVDDISSGKDPFKSISKIKSK